MAAVQPLFEAVQKVGESAGRPELTDKLLGGHGSHAETEVVDAIWRLSLDELDLDAFLRSHGCHAPVQGELASPSWRQDPKPLLALVERYRYRGRSDDESPSAGAVRRAAEREAAERQVLAALPGRSRAGARLLLHVAARQIPLRGVGKAAAARAIDVGRAAAARMGEHLATAGVLEAPQDVFFLTVEEAARADLGTPLTDLIDERRTTRVEHERVNLPARWRGRPEPYPIAASDEDRRDLVLHGAGASAGVVEGRVRVLLDPDFEDVEEGEILVAPFTDPGWASVMFVSSGLVVDIGGLQSHAAVVARELGVPCVMGTADGTRRLRTGDLCRVDGRAGTVEVLEPAREPQPEKGVA